VSAHLLFFSYMFPWSRCYQGGRITLTNNRSKDFQYVKERLREKADWVEKQNLSWMGRATLIKSVAQASPNTNVYHGGLRGSKKYL